MKKILILALMAICLQPAIACTTFFLSKNGKQVFGKNYDWVTGTGAIHTNLKGIKKTSLPPDQSADFYWTSKYGSITFNQYGKEFPNGGMNEKGLVVELMWLDESEYPPADKRPAISVLQWIQYQLDNHATVAEVIASDKLVRIVSTGTPQHYLVADAGGNVATIEFLKGKMVVHQQHALPHAVLANDPYEISLQGLKIDKPGRFTTACKMVQQYQEAATPKPIVDYSFDILQNVAQGNYTVWNIVYDISAKAIHFKSQDNPTVKKISLADFSFQPQAIPLYFNINTMATGKVSHLFLPFSIAENSKLLRKAFAESASQFKLPEQLIVAIEQTGARKR